eukprot:evm.model.scf_430.4 EVM.evm.TU.scf_430.4   scf_430:16968-25836(+)
MSNGQRRGMATSLKAFSVGLPFNAGVKDIQGKDRQPRFRILISDGVNFGMAMLASQMTDKVSNGQLVEGSILRLTDYLPNTVNGRKILIVLQLEVLGRSGKIGDPQALEQRVGMAAPAQHSMNGAGGNLNQNSAPAPGSTGPGSTGPYGQGAWPTTGMYGQGGSTRPSGQSGGYSSNYQDSRGPPGSGAASFYGQGPQRGGGGDAGNSYRSRNVHEGGPYGQSGGGLNPGAGPPQYNMSRGGPIARDETPANITPISSLNPYMNRWTIKARCTSKSDVRRWSNARSEGKVFSFDLLDGQGGEIRVTGFNDEADRYFDMVETGGIYTLSKASLTQKKPQFNHTNHQFEIRLERQSVLERCPEDNSTSHIPRVQYQFRDIGSIQNLEAGTMVDVVGVVERVEPWSKITKKNGDEAMKRPVIIKDKSLFSIEITLWGNFVTNPGDALEQELQNNRHPVIAVKGARVGDFSGKNLSTISSSQVDVDPTDVPEVATLRQWFEQAGGDQVQVASLSNMRGSGGGHNSPRVTLDSIKGMLGADGQAAYCQVAATVFFIRNENMYYPACPLDFNGRQCHKKLREESVDRWVCERCQNNVERPLWRYLLSLTLKDQTGQQIVTAFGEQGQEILGMSADSLKELEGSPDFDKVVMAANFSERLFTLRVHEDFYNDEKRTKVSVVRQERIDWQKASKVLMSEIQSLSGGGTPQQPPGSQQLYQPPPAHNAGGQSHGAPQAGMGAYGGSNSYSSMGGPSAGMMGGGMGYNRQPNGTSAWQGGQGGGGFKRYSEAW